MDGQILTFIAVGDGSLGTFVHILVIEMHCHIGSGIGGVIPKEVNCFAILFKTADNTLACGGNALQP